MKKRLGILASAVALLVVVMGTGCNTTTTGPTTTTTPVTTDVSDEDALAVVTTDVYGKDFDWIERYENSVRSYYFSDEYSTSVTYQTAATEDDLRTYYTNVLETAGWTKSEDATDYVEFTKGNDDNPEIFTVWLTAYPDQKLVEYELSYERALTEAELAEFEEEE
ncbi:MAG: hypothetical protein HYV33_00465 [Candidatus Kerfeldbacteria bacterium]|nr:hypothetical protein [Candidatus Kerfeldbacteria bacterium]